MIDNPYITVNDKVLYKNGKKKNKFNIKVNEEDNNYIYINLPKGNYEIISK